MLSLKTSLLTLSRLLEPIITGTLKGDVIQAYRGHVHRLNPSDFTELQSSWKALRFIEPYLFTIRWCDTYSKGKKRGSHGETVPGCPF